MTGPDFELVLSKHQYVFNPRENSTVFCSCGWSAHVRFGDDPHQTHRAHLAAELSAATA